MTVVTVVLSLGSFGVFGSPSLSSATGVVPSGPVALGTAVFGKSAPASISACVMTRVPVQLSVAPTASVAIGQPVTLAFGSLISKLVRSTLPLLVKVKVEAEVEVEVEVEAEVEVRTEDNTVAV